MFSGCPNHPQLLTTPLLHAVFSKITLENRKPCTQDVIKCAGLFSANLGRKRELLVILTNQCQDFNLGF